MYGLKIVSVNWKSLDYDPSILKKNLHKKEKKIQIALLPENYFERMLYEKPLFYKRFIFKKFKHIRTIKLACWR